MVTPLPWGYPPASYSKRQGGAAGPAPCFFPPRGHAISHLPPRTFTSYSEVFAAPRGNRKCQAIRRLDRDYPRRLRYTDAPGRRKSGSPNQTWGRASFGEEVREQATEQQRRILEPPYVYKRQRLEL
jgi:hypothetical protein